MKKNILLVFSIILAALGVFIIFGVRTCFINLYLAGPQYMDAAAGNIYPYDAHGVTVYFSGEQVFVINELMTLGVCSLIVSGVILDRCFSIIRNLGDS